MLSSYPATDRRRVFLACRSLFSGQNAQIRQPRTVRKVIKQNPNLFAALLRDYGFEKTAEMIRALLEHQIFESELKAKIEFPELFQTSPARNVQHAESEIDAQRSEAEALEDLVSINAIDTINGYNGTASSEGAPKIAPTKIPSLYPLSLPYSIQHLILTTAQQQLEECCFAFATRWLPNVLEDNKWDCAEAVELTKWTKTLPKLCDKLPANAIQNAAEISLEEIFDSTSILRHSAVHRLPTSSRGIRRMIHSATRLATTLGDVLRAAQLELVETEVQYRTRDMQLHKNFLENRLDEQLRVISNQRAELDRREEEAILTMLKEDEENKLLIGSLLETSVRKTFEMDDDGDKQGRNEDDKPATNDDEDSGLESGVEDAEAECDMFVAVK